MKNSIPKQTGASTFERSDASEVNSLRRSLIRSSLLALGSVRLMAACGGGGGGASGLSEIQLSRKTPEQFLSPGGRSNRTPPRQAPGTEPTPLTTLGPLPSWVPAPGEVSTLTQANGRLTNSFTSICAPYYEPWFFRKINNDYSTYVVNPYWGTYGALIGFGGGHVASNDNSVWALDIGQTSCTFKRLSTPSPLFGSTPDYAWTNSTAVITPPATDNEHWDNTYGEYKIDGQPGAPHSYAALDILPPTGGGGASGSLIQVSASALTWASVNSICSVHKMDFPSPSGATGSYLWTRPTNVTKPITWVSGMTQYVAAQQRIYIISGHSPRWFDLNTYTYVEGTGGGVDLSNRLEDGAVVDHTDNYAIFDVPERNLLIMMLGTTPNGHLRLQYLDTTQANPSWAIGSLSAPIAVLSRWQAACWCPDNDRIIVGGVIGDNSAVHEIEIPANLANPWPVTRAPFGAGQTITWPLKGEQTYKKWTYNPRIKALLYMPVAGDPSDVVWVYRPSNT